MLSSEQLLPDLIASCVMASCLLYAGGIGLWTALVRIDWRLRVAISILLLAPLVALQAAEIFWMLGLEALLVAAQVRFACRFLPGRVPLAPQADEPRRPKRFSIATLLFVTALIAGAIVPLKATPLLNGYAWYSLVLIAAASSGCITTAWLATNLAWRWWVKWPLAIGVACIVAVPLAWSDWLLPSLMLFAVEWPPNIFEIAILAESGPTLSWFGITTALLIYMSAVLRLTKAGSLNSQKRFVAVTAVASPLIVMLGCACAGLIPPRPRAPTSEGDNESLQRLLDLSKRIASSDFAKNLQTFGGWDAIPAQLRDRSLAAIQGDIKELAAEVRRPTPLPLSFTVGDVDTPMNFRAAADILKAIGNAQCAAQQPDAAMETFLTAVHLGVKIRRGGLALHELLGVAITRIGTTSLYRNRKQVSQEVRAAICAELARLIDRLDPIAAVLERERHWTLSQDWHSRLRFFIYELAGIDEFGFYAIKLPELRKTEVAHVRLLILELSLSSYLADHNKYPAALEALVPHYLPALPVDPFAEPGQGFKYLVSDKTYQLYSLGENGIDDRGIGHPIDPEHGTPDRSAGDIALTHFSSD